MFFLFSKILIRVTSIRPASHILFLWRKCCDSFQLWQKLCRWGAICSTISSYLRKQLCINVSTLSLQRFISTASCSRKPLKELIVLNWFAFSEIRSLFLKECWTFLHFSGLASWFCPVPFHFTLTFVNGSVLLGRCFLESLFHKGWTNGNSLEALLSKQCNKNIPLVVLFIWPHTECNHTGWAHKPV